jgi:peptidoglycan/xylan/chitin deacetylase (PgdA/CDA1 family)
MDNPLYDDSPIVDRPPLSWPDGKRLAFYVALNVEHYQVDHPSTSIFPGTAGLVPDPLNHGWRDYGPRVGIWRMVRTMDELGLRASVMLNSRVCQQYPRIIEAGRERDWAWIAHGRDNSTLEQDVPVEQESEYLAEVVDEIERATGRRPRGWLGPALTESPRTPQLLADLGLRYLLDWCNDDQPYRLNVGNLLSVPYAIELNDLTLFNGKGFTGPQFRDAVIDQFDQLHAESADSGRVMALCLHPFVVNQPFRHKYLVQALEHVVGHSDVWLTTSDEIAEHYAATADG